MEEQQYKTHLKKKQSKSPSVCTYCNEKIYPEEIFYLEEGINRHIHSLIARKFCQDCYTKYGERILLKAEK